MVFEINTYNYTYSYRPDVLVFAQQYEYQGNKHVGYVLLIEDELYDVTRIK